MAISCCIGLLAKPKRRIVYIDVSDIREASLCLRHGIEPISSVIIMFLLSARLVMNTINIINRCVFTNNVKNTSTVIIIVHTYLCVCIYIYIYIYILYNYIYIYIHIHIHYNNYIYLYQLVI